MNQDYKKWLTFLFFLIAAASLWFIFKYNQVYTEHVPIKIKWVNVPSDLVIQNPDDYLIDVELSGNGFKLLNATVFVPSVQIDFKEFVTRDNGGYVFIPSVATRGIKEALSNSFKVDYVSDEKIRVLVDQFMSKKVPLIKDFEILYEENLQTLKEPTFKPDSVLITGDDNYVNTFDNLKIELEPLKVSDPLFKHHIDLEKLFPNLKTEPTIVKYVVESAVMTEGRFQIPVEVLNVPSGVTVKVIPSQLDVVFNCQLKNYDKITLQDFKVEIDYLNLKEGYNTQVPSVLFDDKMISAVRHMPQQVQLIIIQ